MFIKIFLIVLLLFPCTALSSHIYDTSLYKMANEENYYRPVFENKEIIENIVDKLTYIAGMEKVKIQWVDDNPILDTGKGISFTVGKVISVAPDASGFSIVCRSDAASLLTEDELACVISHELGHIIGDTQKIHAKMKRLANDDYIFLWGPYEESMADKASIALAGIAGYDVTKFKSGLEKIIRSQENSDLYFIIGQESYPSLVSEYPSYGVRMLQYEKFIKDFYRNPRMYYEQVASPDNFSLANVLDDKNFLAFVKEIQKEAKRKVTMKEYINSVISSEGNEKELAELLLIKELDEQFKGQLYYERQASLDFYDFVNTLDANQLERMFDGLVDRHKTEQSNAKDISGRVTNQQLRESLDIRYRCMNDIYKERMNYLLESLRHKGKVIDYQFTPIEWGIEP